MQFLKPARYKSVQIGTNRYKSGLEDRIQILTKTGYKLGRASAKKPKIGYKVGCVGFAEAESVQISTNRYKSVQIGTNRYAMLFGIILGIAFGADLGVERFQILF